MIEEKQLGPHHPSVATTLSNLAVLPQTQGKLTEAEPLFLRALAIQEKQFGQDHSNFAGTLNNLSLLIWRLGRCDEASPLQEKGLRIFERRGDHKKADKYRGQLGEIRNSVPFPYE